MKVLMIGAGRNVKGGVSTVVNQYFAAGLDNKVDLTYIPTMEDGNKIKKLAVAIKSYIKFCSVVNDYDIVHVHMSHRASFYRKSRFILKAKKENKKVVIHMHGSEFDVFYNKECDGAAKEKVKHIFRIADKVIALSEEWKEKLSVFCEPNKIVVLYNAVKLPEFKRVNYNDKNVLFLGRLGKRKGSYDLLEVIPRVLKAVPDAHFYLGGDGDVEETCRIIKDKKLENSVSYIGWVTGEKKDEFLKKSSVFVLPSYHEGMPMSILEAMSYGCNVVSTTVGGIPKVIKHCDNGLLFEPGSINMLQQLLIQTLSCENKKMIGENAYRTIDNKFNIDKNIVSLMRIYEAVLNAQNHCSS